MRNVFFAAAAFVAGATPAFAAQATVNSYTPAQESRAKAAITQAGYQPDALAAVQDGNFFFTATKGDELYQATVTSSGKVFVSTGLPLQGRANRLIWRRRRPVHQLADGPEQLLAAHRLGEKFRVAKIPTGVEPKFI